MKQSNYTTPRTMEEAEFQPWGEAFHGDQGFHAADKIVIWTCAASAAALAIMAAVGWLS